MHATICRHFGNVATDERTKIGRALAAEIGALPGFVAYLLLEEPSGGYISVGIFEDQYGPLQAEQWLAGDQFWRDSTRIATGEVIFQKGL